MPLQTLFPGTFLNTTALVPDSIAGLQGWWSADNGVTTAPLLRLNGAPSSSTNGPTTLTAPSSSGLQIGSSAFEFTFWAVVESVAVSQVLFSKYDSSLGTEYMVYVDTGGKLSLAVFFATSPFVHIVQTANVISAFTPFFGIVGWDGSSAIFAVVDNNVATFAVTAHTQALATGTAPFRIGAYDTTLGPLTGSIGQINLHKRQLTAAEQDEYYNSGNGIPYSSYSTDLKTTLISHWSLTEQPQFNLSSRADSHGTNHLTGGTGLLTGSIVRGGKAARAAANNEAISTVADRSGNSRHLQANTMDSSNASSYVQDLGPFYRTNQLNGLPTITFPGRDQAFGLNFTMPQPAHIFALMKITSWGDDNRYINGNNNSTSFKFAGATSSSTLNLNAGSTGPSTSSLEVGRWQIYELVINGNNSYVQVNGARTALTAAGAQALGGIWFGRYDTTNSALTARLEWAETVMYDSILPHNKAEGVRKYLYDKWGGGSNGGSWGAFNPDKLVVFDGNSFTCGHYSDTCNSSAWQAMNTLGSTWTLMDISRGGKPFPSGDDSLARTTAFYNASRTKNVFVTGTVGDLLVDSAPYATVQQALDVYWAYTDALRAVGWKVVVCTPMPIRADLSSEFDDYETKRQTYIGLMQAQWTSHADALCDVGSNANIGVANAFNNMTYFGSDRIHLNNNGSSVLAGLFATAIQSV